MRVPTSDLHAANACWSLFLLSTYLVVAEAASFDKKELCRSDTVYNVHTVIFRMCDKKMSKFLALEIFRVENPRKANKFFHESFMPTVLLSDVSIDHSKLNY